MSKQRLVITTVHQLEHLITTTLQWDMEMRHEGTALGTIIYQVIIAEIWLQTGDAIALDALHLIQGLHQVDETLMGSLSEVTDVDTRDNNFLSSLLGSLLSLLYQGFDARIARIATSERYRTISAIVIASILHLKEVTSTIATRTRWLECLDFLCLHTMMGMKSRIGSKLLRPSIAEILYQIGFLVGAQHQINSFYLAYILRLQLGIASRHDDESPRVLPHHAVNRLTTLMVGNFRHRASVDQANVSFLPILCSNHAHVFEHLAKSGSFREVEFAAQCIISCFLALEGT